MHIFAGYSVHRAVALGTGCCISACTLHSQKWSRTKRLAEHWQQKLIFPLETRANCYSFCIFFFFLRYKSSPDDTVTSHTGKLKLRKPRKVDIMGSHKNLVCTLFPSPCLPHVQTTAKILYWVYDYFKLLVAPNDIQVYRQLRASTSLSLAISLNEIQNFGLFFHGKCILSP